MGDRGQPNGSNSVWTCRASAARAGAHQVEANGVLHKPSVQYPRAMVLFGLDAQYRSGGRVP